MVQSMVYLLPLKCRLPAIGTNGHIEPLPQPPPLQAPAVVLTTWVPAWSSTYPMGEDGRSHAACSKVMPVVCMSIVCMRTVGPTLHARR
jgi:hypothetical protein